MSEHEKVRVAVLATCFNRRETTLAGLRALRAAAHDIDYRVYLVDDGSTDGTAQAVAAQFPDATIIVGDGTLFWNGGTRRAWQAAIPDRPDYYLLFNDDLEPAPGAIDRMMAFQQAMEVQHGSRVISIGKVLALDGHRVTYGGWIVAPGLSRLRLVRVPDDGRACDTMNGNCVLIPARAVEEVGILDARFRHHTGDIDYGLRARNAGYLLFQTPNAVGRTEYNAAAHAKVAQLTPTNWRFILRHPKGLRPDEWLHFCRRHGGWLWPVNFLARYFKIMRAHG